MTDQTPAPADRSVLITRTPGKPDEWDTVDVITTLPPDHALRLLLRAVAEISRQTPRKAAQAAIRAAYTVEPDSLAALAGSITGSVFNPLRRSTTRRRVYQDDRP